MIESYAMDPVIFQRSAKDKYRENVGTPTSLSIVCQVEWGRKLTTDTKGQNIIAEAIIRAPAASDVRFSDVVIIGGRSYQIINIKTPKDFTTRFKEIWIV